MAVIKYKDEAGKYKPTFAIGGNEVAIGRNNVVDSTKILIDPDAETPAMQPSDIDAMQRISPAVSGNLIMQNAQGDAVDAGVKAVDVATWVRLYNENLLINGNFKINQRGRTEYTSEEYTVDRWKISSGVNLSISPDGVIFSTSEKYRAFSQIAEVDVSKGQHYTLAVNIDTNDGLFYAEAFIESSQVYLGGLKKGINVFTFVAPVSFDRIAVNVTSATDNAVSAKLKGIKLELGDHFTGFYPTDPATELAKCQRYYEKVPSSNTLTRIHNYFSTSHVAWALTKSSDFIVPKRVVPTVKITYKIGEDAQVTTSETPMVLNKYTFSLPGNISLPAGGYLSIYGYEADAEIY